jgi:shikimate kinase / 3-dehydroquinate synthase
MNKNNPQNIILLGFMASGKTRIGELLAERLGFNLIDIDRLIEQEAGQDIKTIFKEKGESYFRDLENSIIRNLKDSARCVIVTGGGAPTIYDNAIHLKNLGVIFFLDANFSLITKRLKGNENRPLGKAVSNEDINHLKELFVYRRSIYLNLGYNIDVNHENKEKTCDDIIERFSSHGRLARLSKTEIIHGTKSYPIFHDVTAIKSIKDIIISQGLKHYQPVIITTSHLKKVLRNTIEIINDELGSPLPVLTFEDGEQHKTMATVSGIHESMFKHGFTRKTLAMALGGGNVGDVVGFASSIYLRGLPFIQIPSTLLAMVDASIGGKTGVDVSWGKNLLGAFHNPHAVIIDPNLLQSLPKEDFSCGMAEIIKHALIADRDLFFLLKNENPDITDVIRRALLVKADIVFNDPYESNIRAHLNLGHTFAHAIEKVSNYEIKHGAAVAIGLVLATKQSRFLGLLTEDFLDDLLIVLDKFHLPTSLPKNLAINDLIAAMQYDKKRDAEGLHLILPTKIGQVVVQRVSGDEIRFS